MADVARRQLNAIRKHKAMHPEIDWDHHIVVLNIVDHGVPFEQQQYTTTHRAKTEYDYKMDRASCWCCMQEVCTCDPPHPH